LMTNHQRKITPIRHPRIDRFPRDPKPYAFLDWKQRAIDFDRFVYDWDKESEFPTIAWDKTHYNMDTLTYKMPAYYGDKRLETDGIQDGITQIGSVIGATLMGIDKSNQDGYDYVHMLQTFKHSYGERKLVHNYPQTPFSVPNQIQLIPGVPHAHPYIAWWYDLYPSLLYYMVGDLYPQAANMGQNLRDIADKLAEMVENLGGSDVDFNHQAYDFDKNVPVSKTHKIPETGIGVALMEYWAYRKFGEGEYLETAKWSLDYYERIDFNPYFEVFPSFGPYIAARMNAELGTSYNTVKYFDWLLSGSDVRRDYGTIEANWNGYDVYGLQGGRTDGGGYGFLLETCANAFFAPAVKYDHRLAAIVGRWLLNICNACRFFYPDQMPADRQYHGDKYRNAPEKVIAYEGIRFQEDGKSPCLTGDSHTHGHLWGTNPEMTELGLYGSSSVGFLGAIFNETNVPKILQIDCNALDFFKDECYPTYLYYNPYDSAQSVEIELDSAANLFDVLTGQYIEQNVSGTASFSVPADGAVLLVVAPVDGEITYDGNKTLINGIPVAYQPVE
jgi:hypothetical protein